MPAKPRPRVDERRVEVVRRRGVAVVDFRVREPFVSVFAGRALPEPDRPDFLALGLMCLYCRFRFGLAPRGI